MEADEAGQSEQWGEDETQVVAAALAKQLHPDSCLADDGVWDSAVGFVTPA